MQHVLTLHVLDLCLLCSQQRTRVCGCVECTSSPLPTRLKSRQPRDQFELRVFACCASRCASFTKNNCFLRPPLLALVCNVGRWNSAGYTCLYCSRGYYCPGGYAKETICETGKYTNQGGQSVCKDWGSCSPGEYIASGPSISSDRNCENCPVGKYSTSNNQGACLSYSTVCDIGKYIYNSPSTADRSCATCASGKFTSSANQGSCSTWSSCAAGKYVSVAGTSSNNRICEPCGSGTYSTTTNAAVCTSYSTTCVAGTYVSATPTTSERVCTPCSTNTFTFTTNQGTCLPHRSCSAGTYVVTSGTMTSDRVCMSCQSGKYSTTTNAAVCAAYTSCTSGSFEISPPTMTADRKCVGFSTCNAGTYVAVEGTATSDRLCSPCWAGKFTSSPNQVTCTSQATCSTGTFVSNPGTSTTNTQCTACSTGTYTSTTNQLSCMAWTDCRGGFFVSAAGSDVSDRTCSPCETGKFSSTVNAGGCMSWHHCSFGYYALQSGTATSDRVCSACSEGTFSDSLSQESCAPWSTCPSGTYVTSTSSTADRSCATCDVGTFTVSTNADSCSSWRTCGPGTYVQTEGSTTSNRLCTACTSGTWSNSSDQTSCSSWLTCGVGQYVVDEGTASSNRQCGQCGNGSFTTSQNAAQCDEWQVCVPGQFAAVQGTASSDKVCSSCISGTSFSTTDDQPSCTLCSSCSGGLSVLAACTVTSDTVCSDLTPPTITLKHPETGALLNASNPYIVEAQRGGTLLAPLIETSDNSLGEVFVTISPSDPTSLSIAVPQTFVISYTATDSSDLITPVSLTVKVVDTTPPVIQFTRKATTIEAAVAIGVQTELLASHVTVVDNVDDTEDLVPYVTSNAASIVDVYTPGNYTVHYQLSSPDANGNEALSQPHTIIVKDTVAPLFNFTGYPVTHEGATEFSYPRIIATDALDGDRSAFVTFNETPKALDVYATVGTQTTFTYSVSDAAGNTRDASRTIAIVDTTAPTVTLQGPTTITHEAGTQLVDQYGASGQDSLEGDLTAFIQVELSFNELLCGVLPRDEQQLYTVKDSTGNVNTAARVVHLVDTTAPTLTLRGENPFTFDATNLLDDAIPGVDVGDTCDPTPKVTLDASNCDRPPAFIPFTCVVSYRATDSHGNSATVEHTVNIVDETAPVFNATLGLAVSLQGGEPFTIIPRATDAVVGSITPIASTTTLLSQGDGYTLPKCSGTTSVRYDAAVPGVPAYVVHTPRETTVDSRAPHGTKYSVVYTATDKSGNVAQLSGLVLIEDTTAPTLSLQGSSSDYLEYNQVEQLYTDPGFIAIDGRDGSVEALVCIEVSAFKPLASGPSRDRLPTYQLSSRLPYAQQVWVYPYMPSNVMLDTLYVIKYTASDLNGNSISKQRLVLVRDTTSPVFDVEPLRQQSVPFGTVFREQSVTATDSHDGDVTDAIVRSVAPGYVEVNVKKPGSNLILYMVEDSQGNSATVALNVTVEALELPDSQFVVRIPLQAEAVSDALEVDVEAIEKELSRFFPGSFVFVIRVVDGADKTGNDVVLDRTVGSSGSARRHARKLLGKEDRRFVATIGVRDADTLEWMDASAVQATLREQSKTHDKDSALTQPSSAYTGDVQSSTTLYIIVGCAGGAVLLAVVITTWCCCRREHTCCKRKRATLGVPLSLSVHPNPTFAPSRSSKEPIYDVPDDHRGAPNPHLYETPVSRSAWTQEPKQQQPDGRIYDNMADSTNPSTQHDTYSAVTSAGDGPQQAVYDNAPAVPPHRPKPAQSLYDMGDDGQVAEPAQSLYDMGDVDEDPLPEQSDDGGDIEEEEDTPWFHEGVDRATAVHLLTNSPQPTAFLVHNGRRIGTFTLSVKSIEGSTRHYVLAPGAKGWTISGRAVQPPCFELTQLIERLQTTPMLGLDKLSNPILALGDGTIDVDEETAA
eukprot:m.69450 g.69450  ORF g.69450 m.69450 type:complete len:1903 (+) comp12223_c1_seq3:227-5935(+)